MVKRAVPDMHGRASRDRGPFQFSGYTGDSSLFFSSQMIYDLAMAEKKVTGPASYFPSIEKKYGKPIEHWMKELKKVSKLAHME